MQSYLTSTAPRKPAPKAYRAIFHERTGVLSKIDGEIIFFDDDGLSLTVIEPEDCMWIVTLAEVGLASAQHLADLRHGGAARICCTRLQETL
jgi:hypothetical protein